MPLLELKEIVAGYSKELDILKGVSLKVSESQIISIIWPNGAGKSTIFKTIFGIIRIKKGSIYYAGEEIIKDNGMSLMNVSSFVQYVVKGIIIILAVFSDVTTKRWV